jgi:formylglycine-generating enzyme
MYTRCMPARTTVADACLSHRSPATFLNPARQGMLLRASALAAALTSGCNGVLGYESDYTLGRDASLVDASAEGDGGEAGDASTEGDSAAVCDGGAQPIGANTGACCTPNELACAGHGQKLVLICDPKSMTWSALQSCSGKQLCDTTAGPNQGTCQDPVALCLGHQPGDKLCDGNTAIECGEDLLTSVETVCQFACVAGVCAGACKEGEQQCNGLVPQRCDGSGSWQGGPPCAYVCVAGACSGSCTPGAEQCTGKTPRTCDANGTWQDGAPCAKECSSGVCVDSCVPGSKQCSGNVILTCDGTGTWQDGTDTECPYVCSNGACLGVCSPDAQQCSEQTPQRCDAQGAWQDGAACAYVCSGGTCSGECVPSAKECQGLVPRICDGTGQWLVGAACTYVCSAAECSGVCTPGDKQCDGLAPQDCDLAGQWQAGAACPYNCTAGTCAGSCTPAAKQCNGLVPQTCEAGSWQDEAACQYVCLEGACSGECAPGAADCNGQEPRKCDANGAWLHGSPCQWVCNEGACGGHCTPGSTQCSLDLLQTCQLDGEWDTGSQCPADLPLCSDGKCVAESIGGPSCAGLPATCGATGYTNCCASNVVPPGTFKRSYDGVGFTNPAFEATVSTFRLDTYEITVGRFRRFVAGYPGNKPAAGTGANPGNTQDPGWNVAWNDEKLLSDATALSTGLKCYPYRQTWTDLPGKNENRPINCVTWYEAFAFCIWDGGRLPTEAEWNYAAAGGGDGDGQRVYPWSVPHESTTIDASYAVYASSVGILNVGSKSPKGDGRWGHADLAGNLTEWVLDMDESPYPTPCVDCANLTSPNNRVFRGGAWLDPADVLRASTRIANHVPHNRFNYIGFRCARQ